jgi:hypothetical protein
MKCLILEPAFEICCVSLTRSDDRHISEEDAFKDCSYQLVLLRWDEGQCRRLQMGNKRRAGLSSKVEST